MIDAIHKATDHLVPGFLSRCAETAEEATWTCPTCGEIAPHAVTFRGYTRYVKQKCACEQAFSFRLEREKIRAAMRAEAMQHTYTWLGARWADSDLVAKTFATFQVERQARAYEAAQAFVANPEGTLVLYGTFGTGKTHLLAAICNASLHQQKPTKSLFTTSPNLFAAIQARIQAKEDYTGILTAAIQTPLLVLDDIDKAKWSEFREEVYFEMVDKRVKAGRPMAISTNKLDALASYVGGAVCSRFKVGQIAIEMVGTDFREEL